MKSTIYKKCVICQKLYHPDKRTAKRQKVCGDLKCKRKYKNDYNTNWRKRDENIHYFKGRYAYLKSWLQLHPGYLQCFRVRKKSNADIQVQLTTCKYNQLNAITLLDDIQVQLNTNINNKKDLLINQLPVDIQVQLNHCRYVP
jgi:hypothetical protein